MPLGPAKLPQEGPKIGKQANVEELPEGRRAGIGDFEKAMADRGLTDPPPPPAEPPEPDPDETQKIERGVQVLEALKALHAQEDEEPQENPSDPIEELAEPTADDKQEFIRCVLGSRPYKKDYALFDGTAKLQFTDVPPMVEEKVYRALALAELPPGDDWAVMLDRMQLVAGLSSDRAYAEVLDPDKPFTVEMVNERIAQLPSTMMYRTMLRTSRIFRRHLEIMLERSLDSDFWRVDGFNSPPEPLPEEPSTTDENPDSAGS